MNGQIKMGQFNEFQEMFRLNYDVAEQQVICGQSLAIDRAGRGIYFKLFQTSIENDVF